MEDALSLGSGAAKAAALFGLVLLLGQAGGTAEGNQGQSMVRLGGMAQETEQTAIVGRPSRIAASVGLVDASWISLRGDYHMLLRAPFESVRAILLGYEDYPRSFSAIAATQVERGGAGAARVSQRSVVRALGFAFPSDYTLEMKEDFSEGRGRLEWRSVADDGSVRDIAGSWYLESVRVGSEDCTYARYTLRSSVRAKFPLQREIMSAFVDGSFFTLLRELERAAKPVS